MKSPKRKQLKQTRLCQIMERITWKYPALAFLIPFLFMLMVMLIGSYEPFGNDYAMLYSDQYHQYYPFFVAFRDALRNGESLLYSWDVGMGMDYLGLIAYYLASPLNLLSVIIPDSWTLEYFALLTPIRMGLAGLFFALFLKGLFGKNDLSISLFGAFYGLCAWALGYQWNVMWLDTFALLPLVALGTVYLLRDRKIILYTVTLFLSIFSNYYIGLFTCIFVLLLFICYEICRFPGFKRFALDLGRIALFSILAIGMTAILELPALSALQDTQSSVNTFPKQFELNIVDAELCKAAKEAWEVFKSAKEADAGFFTLVGHWFKAMKASFPPIMEGMRQVAGNMGGSLEPTFKEGLPNLYCGVGTILLAFLFLTTRKIKLRDKICSVCLLLFFIISFLVRQLDYVWHGFHFTNMIPYRFSFLFSFVLLYMAYRAWLLREHFRLWQFIVAGVLALGLLLCSDNRNNVVYLAFNLAFLLLYLGAFLFVIIERMLPPSAADKDLMPNQIEAREHRRYNQISVVVCIIMVLELILNVVNFGVRFPATTVTNYPSGTENTASMIRYMHEREQFSDFFRAEVTHAQTLNDGALNGYNGISTFTSSANVRVTEFMEALGYGAKNTYNRYCFEEASPVSNLFLNLKYMIERDGNVEENSYFNTLHGYNGVYLLENNAYLPLGFLAESPLADLDMEEFKKSSNNFSKQNELFRRATGIQENVWSTAFRQTEITGSGMTLSSTSNYSGFTRYATGDRAGYLRFTYTVGRAGFLCLDIQYMTERNNFTVYKNGVELYTESISLPQMLSVCEVEPGDKIEVAILCRSNEEGTVYMRAGVLKEEVFRRGYDILNASTLDLISFSSTRIEGKITCNRDGLLYTSIPNDGNWYVEVDGEEAEITLIGDAMIGVQLAKGNHTLTFRYRNQAFIRGLLISLGCAAVFAGMIYLYYVLPKEKGKFEKSEQ